MSASEEIAEIEVGARARADHARPLRLLAPWQEAEWEHPDAAGSPIPEGPVADAPKWDRPAARTALLSVIREWRVVSRELDRIDAGSCDRTLLEAEDAVLRSVHHRLFLELSRG